MFPFYWASVWSIPQQGCDDNCQHLILFWHVQFVKVVAICHLWEWINVVLVFLVRWGQSQLVSPLLYIILYPFWFTRLSCPALSDFIFTVLHPTMIIAGHVARFSQLLIEGLNRRFLFRKFLHCLLEHIAL